MNKLLDKAKPINNNHVYTNDEVELAVAWAKDKIGTRAVGRALGKNKNQNVYPFLALSLKAYIKKEGS